LNEVEKIDTKITFTSLFTDFDGKFKARLSGVIPTLLGNNSTSENAPISAKYDCRIKVEYHKDIMTLVEEGMIIACRVSC
jgi:hypothetical protein